MQQNPFPWASVAARRLDLFELGRRPDLFEPGLLLHGRDGAPVANGDHVLVIPCRPDGWGRIAGVHQIHHFYCYGVKWPLAAVAQCYQPPAVRGMYKNVFDYEPLVNVWDYEMIRCRVWPQTWLPRRISTVKRLLRRRVLMRRGWRTLRLTLCKNLHPFLRWTIVEFLGGDALNSKYAIGNRRCNRRSSS